jgi:quinol monooxygenase YgiN
MFARIVEFIPDFEKKEELVKTLRNQVLPILKKQSGFLEILPLFPENEPGKVVSISLWTEKRDAERFERETYPRVHEILKPYLNTPISYKLYKVETTLSEHFVEALTV